MTLPSACVDEECQSCHGVSLEAILRCRRSAWRSPLAMVSSLGLLTPIGSTLVGAIFLTLNKIGRDLETPFENRPSDISLTAITRTIEINLKQTMAE